MTEQSSFNYPAAGGMGLQLLGSGMNAIGQQQGAAAMRDEYQRQMAEQMALSQQARDKIASTIPTFGVGRIMGQAGATAGQGQQALAMQQAAMGKTAPMMGQGAGLAAALQARQQAAGGAVAPQINREALNMAPGQVQAQSADAMRQAESERALLEEISRLKATAYEAALKAAATRGSQWSQMGQMAAAGGEGMQQSALWAKPQQQTPNLITV